MSDMQSRGMVRIDREVRRQLKLVAVARGKDLQVLLEEVLLDWCRRQPEIRKAVRNA